jgi:anti-sigma B factor antagonist
VTRPEHPLLTVAYDAACGLLTVTGELDLSSAPALREALGRLLDSGEVPDLAIDASGVTFADSSGLAVLLMGAKRWKAEERRLVLRRPSPALTRVIDLTGARRAFEVEG